MNSEIIGRNIAIKRAGMGWTQAELAKRLNSSQPYINRLESGKVAPKNETLAKIAKLFRVSPESLTVDQIQIDYQEMINTNLNYLSPAQVRLVYQLTTEFRNMTTEKDERQKQQK